MPPRAASARPASPRARGRRLELGRVGGLPPTPAATAGILRRAPATARAEQGQGRGACGLDRLPVGREDALGIHDLRVAEDVHPVERVRADGDVEGAQLGGHRPLDVGVDLGEQDRLAVLRPRVMDGAPAGSTRGSSPRPEAPAQGEARSGRQASAAHGHDDDLHLRPVVGELEPHGRPRRWPPRRRDGHLASRHETGARGLSGHPIRGGDLRAVIAAGLDLVRVGVRRHDDRGGHAGSLGCPGQARPWLPRPVQVTPAARRSGVRRWTLFQAPRDLKAPATCRFSSFRRTSRPGRPASKGTSGSGRRPPRSGRGRPRSRGRRRRPSPRACACHQCPPTVGCDVLAAVPPSPCPCPTPRPGCWPPWRA